MANNQIIIGSVENIFFHEHNIQLCARIDTGAKTSVIGVTSVEKIDVKGRNMVKFSLDSKNSNIAHSLPLVGIKNIMLSNGCKESRCIIQLQLYLADTLIETYFSLSDRSSMKYPILIGRSAFYTNNNARFLIDPVDKVLFK